MDEYEWRELKENMRRLAGKCVFLIFVALAYASYWLSTLRTTVTTKDSLVLLSLAALALAITSLFREFFLSE